MRVIPKLAIAFGLVLLISPIGLADPALMVTSYTLTPGILMPGDTAELQVVITNLELTSTTTTNAFITGISTPAVSTITTNTATIQNIWIVPDGDGGNTIKAQSNIPNIGDLAPGASMTVSFRLTAHENITPDLYYPVLNVDVNSYQDVKYPIPIRVSSTQASLLEKNVPLTISQSGSTPITITAVNKRETVVEDVTISVETNENLSITPQTMYLGTMDSETSEDLVFSLQPSQINKYNITFVMTYRNGENNHNSTLQIPIEIVSYSDVSPVLYSIPKTISLGSSDRIKLEVYNAKTEAITGVIVIPESDLTILPSQFFIGAMDPDDVFSASFDIDTSDASLGNHSISFKVIFKQDTTYFESPSITRSIQVITPPPTEHDYSPFILTVPVLILFVVIILFYLLRKRRRR
jgi:hypothetical protein